MAHRLRREHDAIVVGVGTVLADDPQLTCRGLRGGRDPIRVVLDSGLRTPPRAAVVRSAAVSKAPTLIFTTRSAPKRRALALEAAGAVVVRVAAKGGRVDARAAMRELARRDVLTALLEGGPTVAGSFWRARAVDRVAWFVAPRVLADPGALPVASGAAVSRMADARVLEPVRYRRLGRDILIDGRVRWGNVR